MLNSRFRPSGTLGRLGVSVCCLSMALAATASAESVPDGQSEPDRQSERDRPSRRDRMEVVKPSFDPAAEKVELFAGVETGDLQTKVVANGPLKGLVFIENTTDKPLTVQLPDAFVGVQVLHQFGGGGMGGMGMGGMGGMGMGGMGMGGMGGGMGQSMGGGMGGMGMGGMGGGMGGMGGGMGGGGGFFSIPPGKAVKVPYCSVCLNHGRPDPHPRMNYQIMPVEQYTDDETLQELVRAVGTGRIDPQSAQAATWHLTDKMSWRELAVKQVERLGGIGNAPYFSRRQLLAAQSLVAAAGARAREREKDAEPAAPATSPGTRTTFVRTPLR